MNGEIKIAHVHLETPLVLSEEFVQLLIIENPTEFYSVVSTLVEQFEGAEGDFIFSQNEQIINPSKFGAMVPNLFNFDLNDKKLLNVLHKNLESVALGEKLIELNSLIEKTMEFISELSFCLPFSVEFNQPQPIDFFKIAGVKFETQYESLEEKIVCYVNCLIELKKCEFFVFVNLKSVLSNEKLQQIYSHCQAEHVGLLLIESAKLRPLLSNEKAIIITEDLCEVLENYNNL